MKTDQEKEEERKIKNEKARNYYHNHPEVREKTSKRNKDNYEKDPEKYKNLTKKWVEQNPEKKKELDANYREANKEQIKDYLINYRKDPEKREQILQVKKNYHQHILKNRPDLYEKWKIQLKKNYDDLRWEILIAYSPNGSTTPVCSCKNCPETLPFFLTIDHENNNGSQHRKEVGTGRQFYKWLKDNDFPLGYRTMCFNCNSGRELMPDKSCPHELL